MSSTLTHTDGCTLAGGEGAARRCRDAGFRGAAAADRAGAGLAEPRACAAQHAADQRPRPCQQPRTGDLGRRSQGQRIPQARQVCAFVLYSRATGA